MHRTNTTIALFATALVTASALAAPDLDDTLDAKLGLMPPHRPQAEALVLVAPHLNKSAASFRMALQRWYQLENGWRENYPVRFVGWKLPEGKSVLIAKRSAQNTQRKLLIGGVEVKDVGRVHDAALVNGGQQLALVTVESDGMVFRRGDRRDGPYDEVRVIEAVGDRIALDARRGDQRLLVVGGKEYPVEGEPYRLLASPDGKRLAWEERFSNDKRCAVVDGVRGPKADRIRGGIQFSPNSKHVAYVTRQAGKYQAWINNQPAKSAKETVTAYVLNSGKAVRVETWKEKATDGKSQVDRCRLVVGDRVEQRTLGRPVYTLLPQSGFLFGASRNKDKSTLVWVAADGHVQYEDVKGEIGYEWLTSPDGKRRAVSIQTKTGVWVDDGAERRGPYDKISRFVWLRFSKQFAYVAQRNAKVQLVVGAETHPIELNDFHRPVRFSKTEMTAVVVGTWQNELRQEIWSRAIPLD